MNAAHERIGFDLGHLFGKRPPRRATGALADFYQVPALDPITSLRDAPLLAVDVETTGLNPRKDLLLSIGWVPIDGLRIRTAGAGYSVIHHPPEALEKVQGLRQSATIHGLTHTDIAEGEPLGMVLERLLASLKGRAMVVHFSQIEREFLTHACRKEFGSGLKMPIADTFAIEKRHFERMATFPRGEELRLPRVRERYGLPHYGAHNALSDALACGELLLAMIAHGRNRNGDRGDVASILES